MEKTLIVNLDKCTGCRVCQLICSMNHQGEFNPEKSYIKVFKNKEMGINIVALDAGCDYCRGKGPECVQWCMPKALNFVDTREAIADWKGSELGSLPAPVLNNR